MRLHWLQHEPFEGLGYIQPWAGKNGFEISCTKVFENEELPAFDQFDWLVVMGGGMSVYEEDKYLWMKAEKDFIRRAIDSGKIVVGICLGAQLIADVLGGKVYKGPYREIGWYPVSLTEDAAKSVVVKNIPERFAAFHWHGDYIEAPAGSIRLLETEACPCQAFEYEGQVLGLQFHLEMQEEGIEAIMDACSADMAPDKYVQSAEVIRAQSAKLEPSQKLFTAMLDNLIQRSR